MTGLGNPTLIERFRQGEPEAFEVLVDRYGPSLRARLASRMSERLRRRISVGDLMQETYLAAHAARSGFEDRGAGSFRAWLFGIADHRLRDAVRRHTGAAKRSTKREVTRSGRPETAFFAAVQRTPSAVAATDEQLRRIRTAMEELSEDYRRVLQLALQEGLTLREVAVRMGRSREAAKKVYGRAVCRLRAIVEMPGGA
jgi:RNA polymerase sigma-70 factor (ECF subfamily)